MLKILENQIEWYNKLYTQRPIRLEKEKSITEFDNTKYILSLSKEDKIIKKCSIISRPNLEESFESCVQILINELVEIGLKNI